MLTPFYIYRHIRPDTNQVFYIGKGKNRRNSYCYERAHAQHSRNNYWRNIVQKNEGLFIVEIVMEFDSADACVAKEKEMIAIYGRADASDGTLANLTDGGDGSWGMRVSDELRAKRSANMAGVRHPNYGKKLSPETRLKKSLSVKGSKHHLYGKSLPADWKEKIRQAKFGVQNPMYGKTGSAHPKSKGVRNTVTGAAYGSVAEAAKAENINVKTLYQYLDGTRKNPTSLVRT